MRKQRSDAFVRRNARAIRRLQRSGQADQDILDADIASLAIFSMVSRTAYAIFVTDRYRSTSSQSCRPQPAAGLNALRIAEPDEKHADQ